MCIMYLSLKTASLSKNSYRYKYASTVLVSVPNRYAAYSYNFVRHFHGSGDYVQETAQPLLATKSYLGGSSTVILEQHPGFKFTPNSFFFISSAQESGMLYSKLTGFALAPEVFKPMDVLIRTAGAERLLCIRKGPLALVAATISGAGVLAKTDIAKDILKVAVAGPVLVNETTLSLNNKFNQRLLAEGSGVPHEIKKRDLLERQRLGMDLARANHLVADRSLGDSLMDGAVLRGTSVVTTLSSSHPTLVPVARSMADGDSVPSVLSRLGTQLDSYDQNASLRRRLGMNNTHRV
jgi:hypothetical protein